MRPKTRDIPATDDLFRSRLDQIINLRHELVRLADRIDWAHLDAEEGRPGIATRRMVGLPILKHLFTLSDEEVCERWEYDPYFQYFCGEVYFQHRFPIERSSLTHWRKRLGETCCEKLIRERRRGQISKSVSVPFPSMLRKRHPAALAAVHQTSITLIMAK